jgi:hypothetical protein
MGAARSDLMSVQLRSLASKSKLNLSNATIGLAAWAANFFERARRDVALMRRTEKETRGEDPPVRGHGLGCFYTRTHTH